MNLPGLPAVELQFRPLKNGRQVFDIFRNKWVQFTPEENVRQHILHYLVNEKGYKKGLISVEKEITINQLSRRYDAVCYDVNGNPSMLIECKAPDVAVTNETFMQIAQYNTRLKVPFLLVTNGIKHYSCQVNTDTGEVTFLKEIPAFTK
ncbi:MAG: type I restriction enzyme HsdR N-terminal domain-containing protein [Flavobacteriales bacterium]